MGMGFSLLISFVYLVFLFIPLHSQHDDIFYVGFKDAALNLTMDGAAKICNNGILQLTNETSRLKGHAFYSFPFHFKNSANGSVSSFSTSFAFAIVPEYAQLGGHGMAFTIAPSTDLSDALPSQYLGLMNATSIGNFSNHIFAVEFDTVQDFEFGDINDNHVGIDINSLVSNSSTNGSYYTDNSTLRQLSFKDGTLIQAWIDYDSVTNLINVTISPFSSKPKIPILSFHFDLSPIFNEYMYVGFSSSTGLLASSHYIMGWRFKMNGVSSSLDLSSLPSLPGPKKNQTVLITAVSLSCVLLAVVLSSVSLFLIWKIKNADVIEDWELVTGPHRFKYKELKQATNGFKDKGLLGCGGFGRVYKGTMPNSKTQVAVKRISHESKQGLREFVSEIASIGRLRHRNLVQLLGWCRRRGDLLLVYEFMANGSLDKYLFDKPQLTLSWKQRFNIIKGVASGLLYLHEGYEQVVIHRDIKASNVLLDDDFNGKLGDFGLARLYEHGANPGTTRVVGTLGYLAPELPRTGKANTGSDVFAFGALLLEVACGRKPIEPSAKPEDLVLVDWVWDKWREGKFLEVVDKKLKEDYEESEVLMVLKLGLICSSRAASMRPSMRQVVRYLEGEVGVPEVLKVPNEFSEEEGEAYEDLMGSFETVTLPTSPLSLLYGRRVSD